MLIIFYWLYSYLNVPNQGFKPPTPAGLIDLDFSGKKLTKEMIPILKEEIFHALIKSPQLPFSFLDENEALFFHNQHFEVLANSKMTDFIENQSRLEGPILNSKMKASLSSAQNTNKLPKHI